MRSRKQLAEIIETIEIDAPVDENIIEEYKDLNDKCETIVKKIKMRKSKKNPAQI